ncbi:hypothetical protein Psuf_092470 [Phytohabitans suffuscus]|uniref:Uncharacterized protein n=1 Tax=Phytohabitans suffuscus TaxID=624315 RepID=A0A6F8Z0T3_9ACTN|nr:hypothetical protein [Phytohabitans suffuscus]BCB91934.1 hypothetical protein Psuf_092470 [Phytohabitans suffuscus]
MPPREPPRAGARVIPWPPRACRARGGQVGHGDGAGGGRGRQEQEGGYHQSGRQADELRRHADQAGADREAEVSDGGDPGDRRGRALAGEAAGRREDGRQGVREAGAEQGEPDHPGGGRLADHADQQAGRGAEQGAAERADGAVPLAQPVSGEPPDDHHRGERAEPEGRDAGAGAQLVAEEDRAPVADAAFGQGAAEGEQAERQQLRGPPLRAGCPRPLGPGPGAHVYSGREEHAAGRRPAGRAGERDGHEVRPHAEAGVRGERAGAGAGDDAHAVHRVQAGEERLPVPHLDRGAVRVDRDVHDAVEDAEEHQAHGEALHAAGQCRRDERHGEQREEHPQRGPAPQAGHDHRAHLEAEHRAEVLGHQRRRQSPVAELEAVLDRGYPGGPAGEEQAGQEEDDGQANPGPAGLAHVRSPSAVRW